MGVHSCERTSDLPKAERRNQIERAGTAVMGGVQV